MLKITPSKEEIQKIVTQIVGSKNYGSLDPEMVRALVTSLIDKYDSKSIIKEAKNKLHQVWGAFYEGVPNFEKIVAKIQSDSGALEKIMQLHSSTAERYQLLPDFWSQILGKTNGVKKIVEYGCGLNGLSVLDFKLKFDLHLEYLGYDIDLAQTKFLNQLFCEFGVETRFKSEVSSIFVQDLSRDKDADLVLLLKLLPTLEQQQKGIALELLNKLGNKYIVVSFPVFSLGRKSKNMTEFYSKWFEELVAKLDFKVKMTKLEFKTELVFMLERV